MSDIGERPEVRAISDWTVAQGLMRPGLDVLLEGFCQRLAEIGVPIWRGFVSVRTLHPTIAGLGCTWRSDEGIRSDAFVHQLVPSKAFLESPFKRMLDSERDHLRVRLKERRPAPFPVVEDLRQAGATDYLAQLTAFGQNGRSDGMTGVLSSWATRQATGFSDSDIEILTLLMPHLGLAIQTRLMHDIAINLLDTYVGPEAGGRILDGEIRRGALDVIAAVIFYADLRGFTALSDRLDNEALVEALNDYFDCLVPPLTAQGGHVLKFLGDGLLATFPLREEMSAIMCERALDAAVEVTRCVDALNRDRAKKGKPIMALDIALHLGDVYWGNVGSVDRLDFTVIGPAVNEAARIEALCAQHDRHILMSETFAKAATRSTDRLVSVGRFALRGVRTSQSIYTLDGLI